MNFVQFFCPETLESPPFNVTPTEFHSRVYSNHELKLFAQRRHDLR